MTTPVQPPTEVQPQAPVEGQAPVPGDVWPPDEATMLALQMDARFSIVEEPAGEQTPQGADRQMPPAGATTPAPVAPAQG